MDVVEYSFAPRHTFSLSYVYFGFILWVRPFLSPVSLSDSLKFECPPFSRLCSNTSCTVDYRVIDLGYFYMGTKHEDVIKMYEDVYFGYFLSMDSLS